MIMSVASRRASRAASYAVVSCGYPMAIRSAMAAPSPNPGCLLLVTVRRAVRARHRPEGGSASGIALRKHPRDADGRGYHVPGLCGALLQLHDVPPPQSAITSRSHDLALHP